MRSLYREKDDRKIDLILKTFQRFSFEELLKLGFSYQLSKVLKFYTILTLQRLYNAILK
jgi:hypothetical protein